MRTFKQSSSRATRFIRPRICRSAIWVALACGAMFTTVGCGDDASNDAGTGGSSGASGAAASGGSSGNAGSAGSAGATAGTAGAAGSAGSASAGAAGAAGSGATGGNAGASGSGGSSGAAGSSGASGSSGSAGSAGSAGASGSGGSLPAPSCDPASGTAQVSAPELKIALKDRWHESWLASPAVADLDGDGTSEIVVARDDRIIAWHPDGSIAWKVDVVGRIWASPIIANLSGDAKLEVLFASRDHIYLLDAQGNDVAGFPITWQDELRSIAAGDVDGDGALEIVVATSNGGPGDVINAFRANGQAIASFPPLEKNTAGCSPGTNCWTAGAYDQNLAVGDLDGDGHADIVAPHDNAYAGFYKGSGELFDANAGFPVPKTLGVRYLHDLAEAEQGYANNEDTALQAHFTNTAPAIADIDGDGTYDVVMLGSVQNAAQSDRLKGVGLWVLHHDASRLAAWQTPFHAPDYLAGLWDLENNIVGATNQVTVADIDPSKAGPELIFAGFDGKIHAVAATNTEIWATSFTTDALVLTGGVVVADLSGDGVPEIVFNTYSQDPNKSALYVLSASGQILHTIALPTRGAMPVPTIADVDGDGKLEIVVSLKDAEDQVESVRVYSVASASTNCMLWPTGRANLLRDGWVR